MSFKVGDKVRVHYIKGSSASGKKLLDGQEYEIKEIETRWPGDTYIYEMSPDNGYVWSERELELVKPKFNIKDYGIKTAMHCKTEEEAKTFCLYLHKLGRHWRGGQSYAENTYFDTYGGATCYEFDDGYASKGYFEDHNYTILEFEDFDWSDYMDTKFTKKDLKNGDVIKRRNGDVEIVCVDTGTCIVKGSGWNGLCNLNDDLTCIIDTKYDVVAVRRPNDACDCTFSAFTCNCGNLVYERKEVEEMTLAEVCKALGKEIKIVKE